MPAIGRTPSVFPRRAALLALALSVLALPAVARAYSYGDTLTVIWRPLPNLPSFVRPGEALTVWANAAAGVSGWNAELVFGSLAVPLVPAGGGYVASRARWELAFAVPADTPEELYDLVLTSTGTAADTSRHCVKVLSAYPDEFYFAQISDTHIPMGAFSSDAGWDPNDTTSVGDFDAVAGDLNLIHPEFVLHTGDLVNEGELEDYLGMFEMARAKALLSRIDAPVFLVAGNHDLGGWQATAPADGTSRRNWWRQFGWPFLAAPPSGDPRRTQDFSFDYGPLHVIGLEGYINSGSYDHYRTDLYGAQSMTADQLAWLAADLWTVQQGHAALLMYHYDFGGTLAGGAPGAALSQLHPLPAGLAGAIWGHVHPIADGDRNARPFDLGLQSVSGGRRTFRIFRVVGSDILPGPMHHSGGTSLAPLDSLSLIWSGPNDATRSYLLAVVTNYFNERWQHARLTFVMKDNDSGYVATGGRVVRQLDVNGSTRVEVEFDCLPYNVMMVTVHAEAPLGVDPTLRDEARWLGVPAPDPFTPAGGTLRLALRLPVAGRARVSVFDLGGRRVATLMDEHAAAGEHALRWDGRGTAGGRLGAGVYLLRLEAAGHAETRRVVLLP